MTLHQTMGVSMPFLVKLELLLSTDMHYNLDPQGWSRKRNAHILGKAMTDAVWYVYLLECQSARIYHRRHPAPGQPHHYAPERTWRAVYAHQPAP